MVDKPPDDPVEPLDGEVGPPWRRRDARQHVRVVRGRQGYGGKLAVHRLRVGGGDAGEEAPEGCGHRAHGAPYGSGKSSVKMRC